jgi:glutamyl-Q tRNA(Asp) synthetase
MARALVEAPGALHWREYGEGTEAAMVRADPAAWGDFLLKGKDMPASYHLAVVVDDAMQGVSDVVRGRDLFAATSAHRLLQALLEIAPPRYRHHRLVRDVAGAKMSKSAASTPLAELRRNGVAANEVRATLGFGPAAARGLGVTIN